MNLDSISKIWIIAGESSGDLYGAELARELRAIKPTMEIAGMGGVAMAAAGVKLHVDSTELGIVGIIEVLKSIPFFLKLLKRMAKLAEEERPDAVVLIDYPGFNLRLAEKLHKAGIPVVYYISPQVWAWKKGRIPKIAANVNKMLCIFPFEPDVYSHTTLHTEFVGHPLLEILKPYTSVPAKRDENLMLLLPGSRTSELKALLKTFVDTALELKKLHPALNFAMPLPREKTRQTALKIMESMELPQDMDTWFTVSVGNTRELMRKAAAGLAASGTVTVEAAILGLPLVVSYRVNWLTYRIAKMLVKLPSITIANLVTGRTVYRECLQYDAVPEKLVPALQDIMPGGKRRAEVEAGITECVEKLGGQSGVSRRVAMEVLETAAECKDKM